MSVLKPYPAYKDSGVEWLGEVPEDWDTWKISHAFGEIGSGTTPPTSEAEWYENGTVPWVTTGELRENVISETKKLLSPTALTAFPALRVHPAGSLAIAMYGATIGRLGILGVDAATNQACCLLIQPNNLDVKFTFYWLLAFKQNIIDLYAFGGGQPNINQEVIAGLKIPAPKVQDQARIARFLDYETARIDALIEEQESLIELLKEKRQAVTSHAVTKGLDRTAPMKNSEVEWLGEVPAHWTIARIKNVILSIEQGWSPQCDGFPVESLSEWGVLKVGCVNGGVFNSMENKRLPAELKPLPELSVCKSDLLVSRANTRELVGSAAVVLEDQPNLMLCDKLYRMRVDGAKATPDFLAFYLGASPVRGQIELNASGASSSMLNIGQSVILEMELPLPSLQEQITICSSIRKQLAALNQLSHVAQTSKELLNERRSALISAAVTGKIDVRDWQPPATSPTRIAEAETA
jgi:type I restriction enzyme S subunit